VNKRRKLIFAMGAGALATPLCSFAQQQGKIWRVGFLTAYSSSAETPAFDSFRQAMRELGYDNGRNIAYETRWAEGELERLPGMAEDLVKFKPDVMLVANTPSVIAAKKATTTIPIVMVGVGTLWELDSWTILRDPGATSQGLPISSARCRESGSSS